MAAVRCLTSASLAAFVLLAATTITSAAPNAERVVQPDSVRRFWQVSQTHSMAQDGRGFLWLGTEAGLVRFDGHSFVSIGSPRFESVTSIAFNSKGQLWFTSGNAQGREIYALVDGNPVLQAELITHVGTGVSDLKIDAEDRVWLLSNRGLFCIDHDVVRNMSSEPGLNGSTASAIRIIQGDVWATTNQGLFAHTQSGFEPKFSETGINSFAIDELNRIWISSENNGRHIHIRDGEKHLAPAAEVANKLPADVADMLAYDGGMLFATPHGTIWSDGKTVEGYRLPDVPGEANVLSLFVDRSKNLWLGTDIEGLLQVKRNPATKTIASSDSKRAATVFSIAIDTDGAIWSTSPNGLNRWSHGQWNSFDIPESLSVFAPRSLSFAPDGSLWISTVDHGVVRFSRDAFFRFGKAQGLTNDNVFSVFHDKDCTLYMGITNGGLVAAKDGQFKTIDHAKETCPATPVSFVQARDGAIWFATAGAGLCRYDGKTIRAWTKRDGLPEDDLRSVFQDNSGVLWVGSHSKGLAILRGQKFESLPLDLGLHSEEITSIIQDDAGFIWLSTPMGLDRIDPADAFALLAKKRTSVRRVHIGIQDGLRSGTFLGQWPASAAKAADGSLWFPNMRGMVQIPHPQLVNTNRIAIPIIDTLLINGTALNAKSSAVVPVGQGNVEVRFSAADLDTVSRIHFWHMLKGEDRPVDLGWKESGDQRAVSYANLPAGPYEMKIAVRVDDSDDEQVVSMRFVLTAPFYRKMPFFAAIAAASLLLVLALYRLRMWRVRDRFNAVMSDRARIARDMHDTLEQGLIAMKLQTESLLKNPSDIQNVTSRAQRLQDMVGASLRDAKSSVWALRADSSVNTDLATALSVVSGWMLRGTEIKFELKRLGPLCRLEPEAQQQVVRIVQEALNNAVKHGKPSVIVLTIDFSKKDVSLSLCDNGAGFNQASTAGPDGGHFGLTGMRERSTQLGASLHISSRPSAGTTISLVVPKRLRRVGIAGEPV